MADKINLEDNEALKNLCLAAVLANEGKIEKRDDEWQGEGDAVDIALLLMAQKAGMKREDALKDYPEIATIPYESENKYAASIHEDNGGAHVFVKGASETLLEMSKDADQKTIKKQEKDLSARQYRVLAFAGGKTDKKESYEHEDLKNLSFYGLAGMRDPLRAEAKDSIRQCKEAGVDVVMITGDQPDTAYAIAAELGLCESKDEAIKGKDIDKDNPQGMKNSKVFVRIEPRQKLDILQSLQRSGHFVAMTGDGVNDAPALKHAHVGVAMGKSGTDVAKESAEIIITDDNIASIVNGIEEGRVVYNNLRKIVFLLIATGQAEILIFFGAISFNTVVPLFAAQLIHIGAMYTPWLSDVLQIAPVSLKEWIILGGCALVVMMTIEIEKAVRRKYFASRKES